MSDPSNDATELLPRPRHPGEFIRTEVMAPLGLSVTGTAEALGVKRHVLLAVLSGSTGVSPEMALRLEKAFGADLHELLRMQLAYDLVRIREREADVAVRRYDASAGLRRRPRKRVARRDKRPTAPPGDRNLLYPEFLPLCGRVPVEDLTAAYEWAMVSDHPECRYAIWSIARNHARAAAEPVTTHSTIMRHLDRVAEIVAGLKSRGELLGPRPDLSIFDCEKTRAAAETGHPEAQVLAYRVLRARSKLATTPHPQRDVLHSHISQTIAAIARLGDQLDLLDYAVPQLSELLSAEERVLGSALQWGSAQSSDTEARILYEKIQKRTYSLYIKKCRGVLKRNRENKNYYVYTKGCLYPWCRELASIYLKSHSES